MKVFCGRLVHSVGPDLPIKVLDDVVIGFQDKQKGGKIVFLDAASAVEDLSEKFGFSLDSVVNLPPSQFLMPGLVDTHIHAPQYVNSGTGYDKRLLDWLQTYTFPAEAKLADLEHARDVYYKAVRRCLLHGTTTACYFATIHLEATKVLCGVIEKLGQRALVGKVCMDQHSPDYYVEKTQQSIEDSRKFVEFALSMKALGDLAHEFDLPVQSHFCEQQDEVAYIMDLFPSHRNVGHIFDDSGLMTDKTLMAHCIYMAEEELDLFQNKGVAVSHCPMSNFNIRSGCLDVRKMLKRGIKLGLGTDVSGGHSPSILAAMRSSIDASRAVSFPKQAVNSDEKEDGEYEVISHHHAFYMATLGGAKVLSMEDKIGNFVVGKEFDALLVDVLAPSLDCPVFDIFQPTSFDDILMKFLYLGDDRNITKRFVAGEEIRL